MANNETKRPVGRPAKERNEEYVNIAGAMALYGVPQEDMRMKFFLIEEVGSKKLECIKMERLG